MTVVHELRDTARTLLAGGQVSCVIGYEVGPRGRTRPAFAASPDEVERLAWNQDCTHNLTTYLRGRQHKPEDRVAVVVKACDSRAINVLLAENKLRREQVYLIGVACEGIRDQASGEMQARCQSCADRTPVVYDVLIGEPPVTTAASDPRGDRLAELEGLPPAERGVLAQPVRPLYPVLCLSAGVPDVRLPDLSLQARRLAVGRHGDWPR